MGNPRAIACIQGVAKMLNIPVEIEMDSEVADSNHDNTSNNKIRCFHAMGR